MAPSAPAAAPAGGRVPIRTAWAVQILAALVGLLSLIAAVRTAQLHALLDAEDFTHAESVGNQVDGLNLAAAAGLAAAYVALCVWERRARRSAATDRSLLTQSDAWALWSWIVPVVSLWIPFLGIRDLDRASRPRGVPRADNSVLLGWWWASWLSTLVLSSIARVSMRSSITSSSLARFKEAILLHGLAQLTYLAAAPLFILVVRRITDQLARRARETVA